MFQKMEMDPRINFVCLDYPMFVSQIDVFHSQSAQQLSDELDAFISENINWKVNIDTVHSSITLPKTLETYKEDFGTTNTKIL